MKLGELGELNRGKSRHRPRDAAFLYGGSYPFIQTGDIKASRGKIISHSQTYSEAGLAQSRLWPKDTMVITIAANIAETAILDYPACFPDSVVGFIANPHKADVRFVEYAFRLLKKRIQHENVGTGSVQDNINLEILNRLEILVPELAEQKAVASILSAFDDKIELNRQMNETLEAMARAIFKDWFVDFGPTRAKVASTKPYLAPKIWNLFPDSLDNEGRPKEWKISSVGAEFELVMGQSPPGDTYNDDGDGIPFFQGRTDFGVRFPTRRIFCTAPTRFAARGDTLVSVRAPVGDINIASEKCCIGRGVAAIRHRTRFRGYTYYSMASLRSELTAFEHTGTVFGAINKAQFENLKVIVPQIEIVNAFEAVIFDIDERINSNEEETATLAATRDLLLPKLMSGEIHPRDAASTAEAVIAKAS